MGNLAIDHGWLALCSCNVLSHCPAAETAIRSDQDHAMQHDLSLRAAARAIYDACYPTEELAPVGVDEAERYGTIHYRRAVEAAQTARMHLADDREVQPSLF